jgi:hypothetical protein
MPDITNRPRRSRPSVVVEPRGFRINAWAAAVGVSRAYVYGQLLAPGRIESVKVGRSRVIVTTPAEFLSSLPRV